MSETTLEQKPAEAAETAASKPVPPMKAILARKLGMTRVFDTKGEIVPVTVLEAGPCPVLQIKTKAKHGYEAIQVGFGGTKGKNLSKPELGHFAKVHVAPTEWIEEFHVAASAGFEPGMSVRVDQFVPGDVVDVRGTIKGKGFAGVVKRHRFKGGPQTHGQSDRWRTPGSSGRERVWPGKRGPGHMGAEPNTVQRLKVVSVDLDQNLMLIKGSVPARSVPASESTKPRAPNERTRAHPRL
jgi:large subunit ribosomal protein L3